ncbi:MAG: hypothetical protein NZM09_00575 [Ignavibacterium sp.]|nr:hypothetical protein [Ignavibacterium sp.]MCX7610587.1 hypothetical protein [Ignavibacterium sp.]MDW8374165.1 hypothetical protein [Ignavibacteriales bacterium]
MLGKIENINLKPEMRNEIKSSKGDSGSFKVHKKQGFADTLTYSSALIFLSSLNWKLKKFFVNSENQIEIEIQFDNYIFCFLINQKAPSTKNIFIKIIENVFAGTSKINKYICEINFDLIKVDSKEIEYDSLNTLFSRVKTFLIPGDKEVNRMYFYNIINGLNERLVYLFSQIYLNVIEFIEKLNSKKLLSISEDSQTSNTNNISISGVYVEYQ